MYHAFVVIGIICLLLACCCMAYAIEDDLIRVLVWSEGTEPIDVYSKGINTEIANYLNMLPGIKATPASLKDPDQGLSQKQLDQTDVLIWWGHIRHDEVSDEACDRITKRIREGGMGFIPLHSSFSSKPFKKLMGKSCELGGWREDGKPEYTRVVILQHPIARGIRDYVMPETDMYSEPFDVPEPEAVILRSRWDKGEEFRSGCVWTAGKGRVFYFRPGHETYRGFYNHNVQRILRNACFGAARKEGPGMESVIPEGVAPKKLADGFALGEGPLWDPRGFLLFVDCLDDTVWKYTPEGKLFIYRKPSNQANGMVFDQQGRLIVCENSARRVTRTERDGTITVLADRYQEKRFGNPNDVTVAKDGSIYFTDPSFMTKADDQELKYHGVYHVKDGKVTLVANDFSRPNGLAVSPDGMTLYVDDSEKMHVRAFDINADGTLSNGRIFADLNSEDTGSPDGMEVDKKGNLWVAGPGGVWVIDSKGVLLGLIRFPEPITNLAFGGPDKKTLYVTTFKSLYKIPVKVEGFHF
jgi:gluconolactonase